MSRAQNPSAVDYQEPSARGSWPMPWVVAIVALLYWAYALISPAFEMPGMIRFMARVLTLLVFLIVFLSSWFSRRRIPWSDRFLAFGALVVFAVIGDLIRHRSFDPFSFVLIGLPYVLTGWTLWLLLSRHVAAAPRRAVILLIIVAGWLSIDCLRASGLSGTQVFEFHSRWSTSAEDRYLAERHSAATHTEAPTTQPIVVTPTDWPEFRGVDRDGVVNDSSIAVNWGEHQPAQLWKHRIGPGWSSIIAVGDRVYTQEQRGDSEAVVCLNARDGEEVWSHLDAGRFEESQGGAGPRATPTFSDGKIYSLSAMGILNCLDAATGQKIWSRDVRADTGAILPMWGFASSPLIINGLVVIYADGGEGRGLLSYKTDSGQPGWKTAFGTDSYSSPQRVTIGGVEQITMLSDAGVVSVSPKDGSILWTYAAKDPSPRSVQPHRIDDGHMLIANGLDLGVTLVSLDHSDAGWQTKSQWTSRGLKPSFNDFVVSGDYAYGLDANILSCVDLKTGARKWKGGRYGYGQVMLLEPQQMLLVSTDEGDVVLVAADPSAHREIARFKAIDGKTWNHPAIAQGKLFIRNGQEIAAFGLKDK